MTADRTNDVVWLRRMLERFPSMARRPQLVVDAARAARLEVLQLLHRRGADLNASWRGYRPLHSLIQEHPHADGGNPSADRLRCFEWLLAHGADPEQLGAWPPARAVFAAAFIGAPIYVERLLAAGVRRDLFVAAAMGDAAAVRRELKRDPALATGRDAGGLTALQCCAASRLGRGSATAARRLVETAELLLDAGADVRARTKSWRHEVEASQLAISAGNAEILELLLKRGADPNRALAAASWREEDRFCELCLSHGAHPDRAGEEGRPVLNEMVRWGRIERALWLLAQGADPNLADGRGWTALHQAASRGNERMFRALVEAGAKPARKDREGRTPLEVAKPKARAKLARLAASA